MPSDFSIVRVSCAAASDAEIRTLWGLWHRVFPRPGVSIEQRIASYLDSPFRRLGDMFVIRDGPTPLATACVFPREIRTARGPLTVQALGGVCSDPDRRGLGLGRAVTRAAFDEIDRGALPVSLFQTGVPEFYAKLGARTVHNAFIDSHFDPNRPTLAGRGSREQPWWSPHVMIYPATFDWPEGEIDLQGPGY